MLRSAAKNFKDVTVVCDPDDYEVILEEIANEGNTVHFEDGQLNALIIPDVYGNTLDYTWYDSLERVTALDAQEASPDPLNIRWSDSVVEVLAEEGDCLLCRHPSSGRELWLPRDFVSVWRDGKTHTEDATDYRLPVSPGDTLSLVRKTQRGCLVKKNGMTGWYYGQVKYSED